MEYLGFRSLTILRNLRSGIEFYGTIPAELFEDCRKGDQTCQSSKGHTSQVDGFFGRVNSDLEGSFPGTRQSYRYYISFLEKSTGLIDVGSQKFRDDALAASKNYKTLREK